MTISATYSPEDNKLRLSASSRLDEETYKRVRAAGFIWAPRQEIFVAPMWTPSRADLCEELAGEIGDEDTSLVERAEARAERFENYSDSRAKDANAAHQAVEAITKHIPLGQPILIGHHSEKRARKDAEKIQNSMSRAVKMWETSEYWKDRAAGALAAAKYKERPEVRARRIKGLESDIRVYRGKFTPDPKQPAIMQHRWNDPADAPRVPHVWCGKGRGGHWVPQESLPTIERYYSRWIAHCERRLEYERAMLEEAGGTDLLKPKPRPTLLPICNYRSPGGVKVENRWNRGVMMFYPQVEMTQAEYARINVDYKSTGIVDNSHRVRTAMVKHELVSVFLTDAKTHTPPPAVESAPKEPRRIPEPIVHQEPTEQERKFTALRDTLKAGVQVVAAPQLFPTPPELADRMVAEADIQQGNNILEPSAGTGAIVNAVRRKLNHGAAITAVEINHALAERLATVDCLGWDHVRHADFLDLTPADLGKFQRVLMNPPFANGFANADIKHIKHALEFLEEGGLLVAICANGPRQQTELMPLADSWEELPEGSFKSEGTGVRTVLLTARK